MNNINRRNIIKTSGAVLAGAGFNIPTASAAESASADENSGLSTGSPVPLKVRVVPGFLSEQQIEVHHRAHYGGALGRYKELNQTLIAVSRKQKSPPGAAFGAMLRDRASKANSVVLHEVYFDGLSTQTTTPQAYLAEAIDDWFGSAANWATDFAACARSASGWAILALHTINGQLFNVASDEHATNLMWGCVPLVALDVYEHAYYLDYLNDKGTYIDRFFDHMDWNATATRYAEATAYK